MALWLDEHGLIQGGVEPFQPARSIGIAQVELIVLTQAQEQLARCCQADTVTALTEIVAHWGDKAQRAAGFGDMNISRWPPGPLVQPGKRIAARQLIVELL